MKMTVVLLQKLFGPAVIIGAVIALLWWLYSIALHQWARVPGVM